VFYEERSPSTASLRFRIGRISAFHDLTLGLNYGEEKAIAL
jgi:hypothetical protein